MYITVAKYFANGEFAKGLSLYPMPLYPLLLVFVHFLIPDWIVSGYVVSITSMILATIPLYYITKTLFGIKPAFWASVIFALLPEFNKWSFYISRDALFLFIFGSAIYFSWQSVKKTDPLIFISTFILAWISILIRIEGILFIPFYFCTLVLFAIINRELRHHFLLRSIIWAGIPLCIFTAAFLAADTNGIAVNRFDWVFLKLVQILNGSFTDKYHQIYDFFAKAENHAPFSGEKYNFVYMTRHYMLIIYLLGIVEIISKLIFPLSLATLFLGLKNKLRSSGIFILCLGFVFILLVYYNVLTRDFIARRFLMIPAFLLLPWVGLGVEKLILKINTTAYKKLIILLISLTFLAPALKTINLTLDKDTSSPLEAQWLTENIKNDKIKIVTNHKNVSFYINLEREEKIDWEILFYDQRKNKNFEKFAFKRNAKIIILKIKNRKLPHNPQFQYYRKIKSFYSKEYTTYIYDKIIE